MDSSPDRTVAVKLFEFSFGDTIAPYDMSIAANFELVARHVRQPLPAFVTCPSSLTFWNASARICDLSNWAWETSMNSFGFLGVFLFDMPKSCTGK